MGWMKLREEELNQLKHDVLANPHTFNQVWAEKYNVSRERIRQLRVEMGLPGVKDFNPVSASKVIAYIRDGRGTLNTIRTFQVVDGLGKTTFMQWVEEYPYLKAQLDEALEYADNKRRNPAEKQCNICKKIKPIDHYYPDKSYLDGRNRRCIPCNKKTVQQYYEKRIVLIPTVSEKHCSALPELGLLPASFFYRSTHANSGLQGQCKIYQKCYMKWQKRFNEINKNPNELTRMSELSMLGDWRAKARAEAIQSVKSALSSYKLKSVSS